MASDVRAGRAYVELLLKNNAFLKGLASARDRLQSFGRATIAVGGAITGAGLAMAAPFVASIRAASDFEESFSKFQTVFGPQSAAVKEWGDNFAQQVGRSKAEVVDFLAQAQDTFVPLGFDPAEAEAMSKQLTTLAVDLASFNNMSDQEAFDRLLSSMVGNTENLRAFGVVAQDAQIKAQAMAMGFDANNLTPYQKALAIMEITMQGTQAAQGDATRTAGSFANRMKALQGNIKDAAVAIGTALLPVVTPMVDAAVRAATTAGDWIAANEGLVRMAAAAAVAVTGLGIAITAVGGVMVIAGGALGYITAAITALANPIVLIGAALAAGAAYWAFYTDSGRAAVAALTAAIAPFAQTIMRAFDGVKNALSRGDLTGALEIAVAGMQLLWTQFVDSLYQHFKPAMDFFAASWGILTVIWESTTGFLSAAWQTAVSLLYDVFGGFETWFGGGTASMGGTWGDFVVGIVEMFTSALRTITNLWRDTVTGLSDLIIAADFTGTFKKQHEEAVASAKAALPGLQREANLTQAAIDVRTGRKTVEQTGFTRDELDLESPIERLEQRLADNASAVNRAQLAANQSLGSFKGRSSDVAADAVRAQADAFKGKLAGVDSAARARAASDVDTTALDAARARFNDVVDQRGLLSPAEEQAKNNLNTNIEKATPDVKAGGAIAATFSAAAALALGGGGGPMQRLAERQLKEQQRFVIVGEEIAGEVKKIAIRTT